MKKLRPAHVRAVVRARLRRRIRGLLVRYARAEPSAEERAGAERRVVILLGNAWGMGGTIRTTLNLATYLADHYDVEIVSIGRWRDKPFFERFPPGVRVVTLEDKRKKVLAGKLPFLQRHLRKVPSVLMHPNDRTYKGGWSLWVDIKLVHHIRRRAGYLMTTRPGLNLIACDLALPGFVTIGQEHMHYYNHVKPLRRSIRRSYRKLDTLTVLTERDKANYERKLLGPVPPILRIANAVRDMGPGRADLAAPVVLAAGRLSTQKGFDLLVRAWAQVAPRNHDWRLRIYGDGKLRNKISRLIERHELGDTVSLEPAARDLGAEMERASIFVMSSRFEGFPLILLEAMSKGMAVVSFDCPTGPADIIDDHRNGRLVPHKDVDALADAIVELQSDVELRRRCGTAAVDTAGEYSMAAIGAQWDELLRELEPKLQSRIASA